MISLFAKSGVSKFSVSISNVRLFIILLRPSRDGTIANKLDW